MNGGLVLDKKQRVIFVEGEEVHLTATEYKILELLMTHPGQVFPAEQIYECMAGNSRLCSREYCNGTYPSYQGKGGD